MEEEDGSIRELKVEKKPASKSNEEHDQLKKKN